MEEEEEKKQIQKRKYGEEKRHVNVLFTGRKGAGGYRTQKREYSRNREESSENLGTLCVGGRREKNRRYERKLRSEGNKERGE